jgi:NitT/TauT family transport system substrate-binding protein
MSAERDDRNHVLKFAHALARFVIAGAAAVLFLNYPSGVARAADHLSLRLDWITEPMHLPFFLADEKGWFKDAGLDVSIEDGNGSTTTVQLVGAGRFDMGLADLSPMAIGKARGLPVISVAGFIRRGAVGFVVPKTTKIDSLADFIGKQVFYTTSSFEGPFVEPLFRSNGVAFDRVNMINMNASAKIPAYLSGRGDAMITTVPPNIVIAAGRRDSYGVLFADYGFNLPSFGLVTRIDTLKARASAVRRFVSVVASAWTYILASHAHAVEAAKITLARRPSSPLSVDMMVEQAESYRPYFYTKATAGLPIGLQADADWKLAIKNMEAAKVIAPGSQPADYFTNDMVDVDYGRKIVGYP